MRMRVLQQQALFCFCFAVCTMIAVCTMVFFGCCHQTEMMADIRKDSCYAIFYFSCHLFYNSIIFYCPLCFVLADYTSIMVYSFLRENAKRIYRAIDFRALDYTSMNCIKSCARRGCTHIMFQDFFACRLQVVTTNMAR